MLYFVNCISEIVVSSSLYEHVLHKKCQVAFIARNMGITMSAAEETAANPHTSLTGDPPVQDSVWEGERRPPDSSAGKLLLTPGEAR